jgi:sec-independent protein translocase protein TatA
MFRSFGPMEIGLILLIILIVFGVGKLPQVGGALGKGIHEFRKASRSEQTSEKPADPKSKTETDDKETTHTGA